jgi:hypothetical protein
VDQAEPPLSAMAMAMRDSVTVSMSDEMIGICSRRLSESEVASVGVLGQDLRVEVASETSSNVSAVGDANGAWNRRSASLWLSRASERPVEFVEQPVAPSSKGADDTLLGLASDFPVPIALDESIVADGDVGRWLDLGWPGFFIIKPALLADPKGVLAHLAKAGARVVFSSSLETAIGDRQRFGLHSRGLGRKQPWASACGRSSPIRGSMARRRSLSSDLRTWSA